MVNTLTQSTLIKNLKKKTKKNTNNVIEFSRELRKGFIFIYFHIFKFSSKHL